MIDGTIDHVAIAVRSIPASVPFVANVLGGVFLFAGEDDDQGFRWAQFRYPGGGKIELVTPLGPDGFLARFLDQRGEGVHHVTFKLPDIARAIGHVRAQGIEPVGIALDDPAWKQAFIHPRDGHGVLVQLVESPFSDEDVARHHLADHGRDGHRHLQLQDLLA